MIRKEAVKIIAAMSLLVALSSSLFAVEDYIPTSPVSAEKTIATLTKATHHVNGLNLYRAEGKSMLPYYGENTVLIVRNIPANSIKPGMIVIFDDFENDTVGHLVIENNSNTLITRGANNKEIDPKPIELSKVIGVVVGSFHTAGNLETSDLKPILGKKY